MGDDVEQRLSRVEAHMDDLRHDAYGNGQPGLFIQLREFLAVSAARDSMAAQGHSRTVMLVSVLGIGLPMLYDIVKHLLGVR